MYDYDAIVVGAGPAGQASASTMAELGLSVLVLDEQARVGGQIYRNIEGAPEARAKALGSDYAKGKPLAKRFNAAPVDYRAKATVWQAEPDGTVFFSHEGISHCVKGKYIIGATGAMERPVPIPGWTLPGVMGAGAANNLYKDSGLKPKGKVVLAGNGPLLLLEAGQLAAAGANIAAVLDTSNTLPSIDALMQLPQALRRTDYLLKGVGLLWDIKKGNVPHYKGVSNIRAHGKDRVERVTAAKGGQDLNFPVDTLLIHFGVIPNTALYNQLGCRHEWDSVQRYWYPTTDAWGRTSLNRVFAAGDGAFVHGAVSAQLKGELAALEIAASVGKLKRSERDERAQNLQKKLDSELYPRPFVDAMFAPNANSYSLNDEALICRCEHVTVGDVRSAIAKGCSNPNDIKALLRCGMGPCQGRMCGNALAEVASAILGTEPSDAERLRIRPPLKNVSMQEIAAMRFGGK